MIFDLGHMLGWSLCGYKFPKEASCRWTEVCSYMKWLKSEVKSNHQVLVRVNWPNKSIIILFNVFYWSSMYVFTIDDFGSSPFTECTSITIHRTAFQHITIHRHQKWLITASQKLVCPPSTNNSFHITKKQEYYLDT